MINNERDEIVEKIEKILKKDGEMTITEIVSNSKLSRSAVRTALAKLDGAGKVSIRKIGMAKVYFLSGKRKGGVFQLF